MRKINKISSWQQFEKDLKKFPPDGIEPDERLKNNYFKINEATVAGIVLHSIKNTFSFFKHFSPLPKEKNGGPRSSELRYYVISYRKKLDELACTARSSIKGIGSKSILANLDGFLLLLTLPFMIVIVIPLLLVMPLYFFILMAKKRIKSSVGYYSLYDGDEDSIFINLRLLKKSKCTYDELVSHEHMHLRQASVDNTQSLPTLSCGIQIRNNRFIRNDMRDDYYSNYLLNRHETEVRLNEMLICYYRERETIPATYNEFFQFLFSFDHLNAVARVFMKEIVRDPCFNINLDDFVKKRSICAVDDLFFIFRLIEEENKLNRYCKQVLPVLYAHLLHYYGDEKAAVRFFKTIPSISLYQELY